MGTVFFGLKDDPEPVLTEKELHRRRRLPRFVTVEQLRVWGFSETAISAFDPKATLVAHLDPVERNERDKQEFAQTNPGEAFIPSYFEGPYAGFQRILGPANPEGSDLLMQLRRYKEHKSSWATTSREIQNALNSTLGEGVKVAVATLDLPNEPRYRAWAAVAPQKVDWKGRSGGPFLVELSYNRVLTEQLKVDKAPMQYGTPMPLKPPSP